MGLIATLFVIFSTLNVILATPDVTRETLNKIRTMGDRFRQKAEVEEMLQRIIPEQRHLFKIEIDPDVSGILDRVSRLAFDLTYSSEMYRW